MQLRGDQFQRIHRVLLNAYRNREDLNMMVRFELSESLSQIADGSTLSNVVFSLIEWAEASGRVQELVTGAWKHNQGNVALQELVDEMKSWVAPEKPIDQVDVPEATPRHVSLIAASTPIDVFLSYSSEDLSIMHSVMELLRVAGFSVWTADNALVPGTRAWQSAIEAAIRNARTMVVLLSPAAKASQWVDRELALAELLKLPIFPVLVTGDLQTSIPISLITYQWVDARTDNYTTLSAQLIPILRHQLNQSAQSAPPDKQTLLTPESDTRSLMPESFPIEFDWVAIPEGEFLMGSDRSKDSLASNDEVPQHQVYLSDYRIARVPVTVAQFNAFVEAENYVTTAEKEGSSWKTTGSEWNKIIGAHWRQPSGPDSHVTHKVDHPVTCVSWDDAMAFCEWAGVRLPTEAEWEKAARGTGGQIYPWGNEEPTMDRCNFNMHIGDTTPVDKYEAGESPYGCLDMAGNVLEWTADVYDKNFYALSPEENPTGPKNGEHRVLRGGAFPDKKTDIRCAARDHTYPSLRYADVGIRVVVNGL